MLDGFYGARALVSRHVLHKIAYCSAGVNASVITSLQKLRDALWMFRSFQLLIYISEYSPKEPEFVSGSPKNTVCPRLSL